MLSEGPNGVSIGWSHGSLSLQVVVQTEDVRLSTARALSANDVTRRMTLAGTKVHCYSVLGEDQKGMPRLRCGRKVRSACPSDWKKLVHDSEEACSRAGEESGKRQKASGMTEVNYLSDFCPAKTMKFSPFPTFLTSSKELLHSGLNVLEGISQKANAEANVSPVFLEGGGHLKGIGEGANHLSVHPEGIPVREHEVAPFSLQALMPERSHFQEAMVDLQEVRKAASLARRPGNLHF